ncbi:MAG: glycoside hydrolase, partial [Bacteroidetes bacterium]|nr:glycoside hydrolase [Bacteroidota bacterium]
WPVIGVDKGGDGKGEPVLTFKKPNVGKVFPIITPQESDEFNSDAPGLQWQWNANPSITWSAEIPGSGYLRLFALRRPQNSKNFWDVPDLLLQKFPAPDFTATTKIKLTTDIPDKQAGLIIMGGDYSYLSVKKEKEGFSLSQVICHDAEKGGEEKTVDKRTIDNNWIWLRVKIKGPDASCYFSYSTDGKTFADIGEPFTATVGKWIGARVGIFCNAPFEAKNGGYADFDWFRITPNE